MRHPVVRWSWLALVGALLAVTAFSGFSDGISNIEHAESTLQRIFIPFQLSYGVAGLAALAAILLRWNHSPFALAVWGVIVSAAAGLAPAAWGGTGIAPALAAGAATAVICGPLVWGQVRYMRAIQPEAPGDADPPPSF